MTDPHRADRPHGSGRPKKPGGPGYSRDGRTGRAPRAGRPPSDPARQAAYETIAAVHRDDAYANLALAEILRDMRLHGRDAAFATELTYGTLRSLGTLDLIIAAAAGRDVARIDPPARDALRLGAYQLLHTRVPAHAAVNQTVDLVRSVAPGATGFANAVMRGISGTDLDAWLTRLAPPYDEDPVGNLSVLHNHPQWIVRAFAEALGGDLDETARLLIEDNQPAAVHLCARPGRADAVELADEVGGVPGAFSPYAVYLSGGSPGELAAIADGRAHVQDEGSQLVAAALLAAPIEGRDTRWLDLCAGPGGKAGLLGSIAALRGAEVTAVEVAEHRARLVEQATAGLPVTVLPMDGRRRAVHRAGLAAPAARGALAPHAGRPAAADPVAARAARRGAARGPAGRRGGVRDVFAACGGNPGHGDRGRAAQRGRGGLRGRPPVAAAGHAGPRRRAYRPAVAAPARHRRDVPGSPAPHQLTGLPRVRRSGSSASPFRRPCTNP